jgi:hypothetical protein
VALLSLSVWLLYYTRIVARGLSETAPQAAAA